MLTNTYGEKKRVRAFKMKAVHKNDRGEKKDKGEWKDRKRKTTLSWKRPETGLHTS